MPASATGYRFTVRQFDDNNKNVREWRKEKATNIQNRNRLSKELEAENFQTGCTKINADYSWYIFFLYRKKIES